MQIYVSFYIHLPKFGFLQFIYYTFIDVIIHSIYKLMISLLIEYLKNNTLSFVGAENIIKQSNKCTKILTHE